MIQALLAGIKTQTRRDVGLREINHSPDDWRIDTLTFTEEGKVLALFKNSKKQESNVISCPYGAPGDLLWVRESWQHTKVLNIHPSDDQYGYVYRADDQPWDDYEGWRWKPSIHMPKDAARIWIKNNGVRIQRLHDITEQESIAEGVKYNENGIGSGRYRGYTNYLYPEDDLHFVDLAKFSFVSLWESIHGAGSWHQNPWLWVVSFEVLSTIGKPVLTASDLVS